MLFSQRKGFTPVRDVIQKDDMDIALRHCLWNALDLIIWDKNDDYKYGKSFSTSELNTLFLRYWHSYFKLPLDNLPGNFRGSLERVRKVFFECEWYEVYDFIEFTAQNCPEYLSKEFTDFANQILEKELSAYRFVDNKITDLTSEQEIESIESAISNATKYSGVSTHLKTSLAFLSDRESPNYRNSIKEAISAVESLSKIVTENPKATLGSALKVIEKSHELHPAFKNALSNLYGYTNDNGGIRHALLEEDTVTYTDAKYMLVSCTAFINYLLGKINE